ncbi:DMT family transporter [Tabrizicola sp. BL-A-41-H6]|uniref:DMT family transporter n=1 Tax=Tabrizicola sp. BL-A-41-H6 TaxID=3421107 RepID=UPI003D672484
MSEAQGFSAGPPPAPSAARGAVRERLFFVAVLVVLGVGWGSTQSLGKMATATGHQPFGLIFWQLVVGAIVLGIVSLVRRRGMVFTREAMTFYAVVATIGTLIPNATFYAAVVHLPAGIMSILISTVPLIAFPMALALGLDRFSALRLGGLLLGLAGVALIANPGGGVGVSLGWVMVAMIGPLFYAMEANYVASRGTAGMDAVQAMFGVCVVGMVMAAPIAWGTGQWVDPFPMGRAEGALVISSVVHALVYSSYVWLASRAGSVFASQCSYLVTASGVLWAMILLGERFSPLVWVALVVMLAGVALVQPRTRTARAA